MEKHIVLDRPDGEKIHVWKLEVRDQEGIVPASLMPAAYKEIYMGKKYKSTRGKPMFVFALRIGSVKMYDGWYASGKKYGGYSPDLQELLSRMIANAWEYA